MKSLIKTIPVLLAVASVACQSGTNGAIDMDNELDRISYTYGVNVGNQLKANIEQGGLEVDPDAMVAAIKDVIAGNELAMTDEQMKQALADANAKAVEKQRAKDAAGEEDLLKDPTLKKIKEDGEAFLAENAKRDGVVVLPSGLQYEVLVEGSGDPVGANAAIQAHYTLAFPGGDVWQSSYESGRTFPVTPSEGGAIQGWLEALPLMKVGAKWKLFIPYHLAYGTTDRGEIKPFQVLVFETEIVSAQQK